MNRTILLIDPNRSARHALATRLTKTGYITIEASNLVTATQFLSKPIDVVCTQLMVRDGNSVELLRTFRNRMPNVKIAVISAGNESGLLCQVTMLKPDALFGVPLDLDDFFTWLSSLRFELTSLRSILSPSISPLSIDWGTQGRHFRENKFELIKYCN
jgi:DNA-binding NarL/FixJ family response regulator